MKMNKTGRFIIMILAVVIMVISLYRSQQRSKKDPEKPRQEQQDQRDQEDPSKRKPSQREEPGRPPSDNPNRTEGFDRRITNLIFTKHAKCRMGCRHIDEEEVREILANGRINDRKSEPAARPDPKYALEGRTRDGQEVRIIFAPSARGMVVITVIDLGKDWACNCK